MEDYTPNSHKYREAMKAKEASEHSNRPPVRKILNEGAVEHNRSFIDWIFSHFGGDGRSVLEFLVDEYIKPNFLDMLYESSVGALDMLIYKDGKTTGPRKKSGNTDYNSISTGGRRRTHVDDRGDDYIPSDRRTSVTGLKNITITDRKDAIKVRDYLLEYLEDYGSVPVYVYYEACNKHAEFTDWSWGWTNLDDLRCEKIHGGYRLNLPKPVSLKTEYR